LPEPLSGVGSMISTAFREPSTQSQMNSTQQQQTRASSLPFNQLQEDLLNAADAISNNMSSLVVELSSVDDMTTMGMEMMGEPDQF
jgi:hypothetical protein